jgi:hypothetical protein
VTLQTLYHTTFVVQCALACAAPALRPPPPTPAVNPRCSPCSRISCEKKKQNGSFSRFLLVPSPLVNPSCPVLCTTSIMPAFSFFPPAAALPPGHPPLSFARARFHSAAACKSGSSCRLLPVAVALMVTVAMSAAFGVVRAQGTWSTAQLSVARYFPVAASVGNVALVAGGAQSGAWFTACCLLCVGPTWGTVRVLLCPSIAAVHMRQCCVILLAQLGFSATNGYLMAQLAGGSFQSDEVDVYNSAIGAWSTAQLSVARWYLAAASVGNVALFAGGGLGNGALLCKEWLEGVYCCVRAAMLWFCLPCHRFLSHARHLRCCCSF